MPTPSRVMGTVNDGLARAVVCHMISRALARPRPTCPSRDREDRQGLAAALAHLGLPELADGEPVGTPEAFDALFGHTARGRVCPYETEYGNLHTFRQSQDLADIQGYYVAFGLGRREDRRERVDHLGVEYEFLGFLARKEALALEAGDEKQSAVTLRAYRTFLRDHLSRFGVAVSARLSRADRRGFYGRVGAVSAAFLRSECDRLDVPSEHESLTPRRDEPDRTPMACGTPDDACGGCDEVAGSGPQWIHHLPPGGGSR